MEDIVQEEWRPVTLMPEMEGYEVSNIGRVRSPEKQVAFGVAWRISPSKILKARDNGHGYLSLNILRKGKQMLPTFIVSWQPHFWGLLRKATRSITRMESRRTTTFPIWSG